MLLFFCLLGYLLSSVPFGFLISQAFFDVDIRKFGSGNIGATNVYRVFGRTAGLLVLLLDGLKGFAPVLLAKYYMGYDNIIAPYLVAVSAVFGHVFPVFLSFRGGKGVATSVFTTFALCFELGIIMVSFWVAFFLIFRISSVASIASSLLSVPFSVFFSLSDNSHTGLFLIHYSVFVLIVIVSMHMKNIKLLLIGRESRLKASMFQVRSTADSRPVKK